MAALWPGVKDFTAVGAVDSYFLGSVNLPQVLVQTVLELSKRQILLGKEVSALGRAPRKM